MTLICTRLTHGLQLGGTYHAVAYSGRAYLLSEGGRATGWRLAMYFRRVK